MSNHVGRSVLVTGSTGGVGHSICIEMASKGWDILPGWNSSEEGAQILVKELAAWPVSVRPLQLDMSRPQMIADAIKIEPQSPLGTLVINAALKPQVAPMGQIALAEVENQFAVSALGPFELIRAVWRQHFKKHGGGHIIVISSAGLNSPVAARMAGYLVGKAALEAVIGCALAEYGPAGLCATILRPQYIDTPMLEAFEPRFVDLLREQGRIIPPQTVSQAVALAAENPPAKGQCVVRTI